MPRVLLAESGPSQWLPLARVAHFRWNCMSCLTFLPFCDVSKQSLAVITHVFTFGSTLICPMTLLPLKTGMCILEMRTRTPCGSSPWPKVGCRAFYLFVFMVFLIHNFHLVDCLQSWETKTFALFFFFLNARNRKSGCKGVWFWGSMLAHV